MQVHIDATEFQRISDLIDDHKVMLLPLLNKINELSDAYWNAKQARHWLFWKKPRIDTFVSFWDEPLDVFVYKFAYDIRNAFYDVSELTHKRRYDVRYMGYSLEKKESDRLTRAIEIAQQWTQAKVDLELAKLETFDPVKGEYDEDKLREVLEVARQSVED